MSALTNYQPGSVGDLSPQLAPDSPRRTLPRAGTTSNKLRYDAYAAPQPVHSLRHLLSLQQVEGSSISPQNITSGEDGTSIYLNELARMVTPGEMTHLAAESPFDNVHVRPYCIYLLRPTETTGKQINEVSHRSDKARMDDKVRYILIFNFYLYEDKALRVDLIALDSPCTGTECADNSLEPDFEEIWNSMENSNVRGWCEVSMDAIVRLLQSLQLHMRVIAVDQSPFEG